MGNLGRACDGCKGIGFEEGGYSSRRCENRARKQNFVEDCHCFLPERDGYLGRGYHANKDQKIFVHAFILDQGTTRCYN